MNTNDIQNAFKKILEHNEKILGDLRDQIIVNKLLVAGRTDLAAAEETYNKLRQDGIELNEQEKRLILTRTQLNESLQTAKALLEDAKNPAQQFREELAAISEANATVALSADQVRIAVENAYLKSLEASKRFEDGVERAFIKLKAEANDFAAVGDKIVNTFADNMTEALVKFAEEGKISFKDFARSLIADLVRIIARLLVVQALTAAFTGGALPGPLPATGGGAPFSFPERAAGGPVQAGRTFLVGEKGPELFTPRQSGNITANGTVAPQAPPQVNIQHVTVLDKSLVPQAITGGEADEAIINVISRNRDRVNRSLN